MDRLHRLVYPRGDRPGKLWYYKNPVSEKIAAALTALREGALAITSTEGWKEWLQFSSRFHAYSFTNLGLIAFQFPSATRVAGRTLWEKLGREVIPGSEPILIRAPFTRKKPPAPEKPREEGEEEQPEEEEEEEEEEKPRVYFKEVPVYDISQTTGPELPKPTKLLEGSSDTGAEVLATCKDWLATHKVELMLLPMGASGANGFYDYEKRVVAVASERKPDQQAKTCVHEVAHLLLHTPAENQGVDWRHSKAPMPEARKVREIEAESVAFIVMNALGVDSARYSFGYVAAWAKGEDALVGEVAKRVRDCAHYILEEIFHVSEHEKAAVKGKRNPATRLTVALAKRALATEAFRLDSHDQSRLLRSVELAPGITLREWAKPRLVKGQLVPTATRGYDAIAYRGEHAKPRWEPSPYGLSLKEAVDWVNAKVEQASRTWLAEVGG